MSKIATSTPKPKAHFKIVFNPGSELSGLKGVKGNRGQGVRVNDLEAAINSITYPGGSGDRVFENASTSSSKEIRKSNVLQSDNQKLEKIVFLPKYVQKKVTVIRDGAKKVITADGISRGGQTAPKPKILGQTLNYTPVKKAVPGTSGISGAKRRKLGDLALETWNTVKKPLQVTTVVENGPESPSMLCRICGSLIEDTVVDLVDHSGMMTTMGTKLKAIVGADINDSPLYPPACCKACSFKVNVCFSLLIELQASDEVVRCTYSELSEGDLVNPGNHIYTCQDCEQEVIGMKDFVRHYENHMVSKTLNTPVTIKGEKLDGTEDDMDDPMLNAQVLLEEDADDGTVTFQNDLGEYVCEVCGRTFKYIFLLHLHRKAPKRGPPQESAAVSKVCFVCKQPKSSTVACKLGDSTIPLCQPCRASVSFMVI